MEYKIFESSDTNVKKFVFEWVGIMTTLPFGMENLGL